VGCGGYDVAVSHRRNPLIEPFSRKVMGNEFPSDGSLFPEVDKALIFLALMRMEGDGWS
jgi:hypothetical protein